MPLVWIIPGTHTSLLEIFHIAGWEAMSMDAPPEAPLQFSSPDVAVHVIDQESLPARFGLFCVLKIMPVLAITPSWDIAQQAVAAGADDVIVAPVNPDELPVRADKLLLRSNYVRVGGLAIDLTTGKVQMSGQVIPVSPIELRLLTYLAQNIGRIVSYDELLDEVWKCADHSGGTREQVKAAIKRLRQKIEPDPHNPQFIITVKKAGYHLRSQRQWVG